MFTPKTLEEMSKDERIKACYQHCCLKYVMSEMMTNQSFRERLGLSQKKTDVDKVSRVISDALDDDMIKLNDPENKSKRYAKYIPFWA